MLPDFRVLSTHNVRTVGRITDKKVCILILESLPGILGCETTLSMSDTVGGVTG